MTILHTCPEHRGPLEIRSDSLQCPIVRPYNVGGVEYGVRCEYREPLPPQQEMEIARAKRFEGMR